MAFLGRATGSFVANHNPDPGTGPTSRHAVRTMDWDSLCILVPFQGTRDTRKEIPSTGELATTCTLY